MSVTQSSTTLFGSSTLRAVELGAADVPRLQRFFELNPEYFFAVNGAGPGPVEAHDEVHAELPAGWPYTKKWIIGFEDDTNSLTATANVVSDLLAPAVWHIGLFVVATPVHGTGIAREMYRQLEIWAHGHGARWLRLGVVQGNARAERFWERHGFAEVRIRAGVKMGTRVNTLRVMCKPLAGGTLAEYLALVSRDRPETD
jgi:GNAT superfamily N-acetyltransferase